MIDLEQATSILKSNMPSGEIKAVISYQKKFIFSVFTDDPIEGQLDPFYSVDQNTGEFSGFSIVGDANTTEILDRFQKSDLEHSSILKHYGVLGMKWGVRKDGMPQGYQGGANKEANKKTLSAKMEAGSNFVKPLLTATNVVPTANLRGKAIQVAAVLLQSKTLTTTALKAALKTSLASPAAIAGYAVSALDSGAYRVPVVGIKNAISGGWTKKKSLANPKLTANQIQDQVVDDINQDYPKLGTTNNCLRCTYAYELRRRGYDVAATKTFLASGQTGVGKRLMTGLKDINKKIDPSAKFFENHGTATKIINSVVKKPPTADDIFKALASQPDRSRGDLNMSWGLIFGGHSVAYEIVNGKPIVFDTQSGKRYSTPAELSNLTARAVSANFTRLDNKDLNDFLLTAWIKENK